MNCQGSLCLPVFGVHIFFSYFLSFLWQSCPWILRSSCMLTCTRSVQHFPSCCQVFTLQFRDRSGELVIYSQLQPPCLPMSTFHTWFFSSYFPQLTNGDMRTHLARGRAEFAHTNILNARLTPVLNLVYSLPAVPGDFQELAEGGKN